MLSSNELKRQGEHTLDSYGVCSDKFKKLLCTDKISEEATQSITEYYHYILSTISHEVKNPLTYINSSLQLTELQHPEVKAFEYWPDILSDVNYLIKLFSELTSVTRGYQVNSSKINLSSLIKSVVKTFKLNNTCKPYELTTHFGNNIPNITGDSIKLKQVIINILNNAYDAIDNNGIIDVHMYHTGNSIQINISDNGCGIPPSLYENIWNPFVTSKENGSGIGLSLVQRIIKSHKGKISFTSKEGIGTTFTILLPLYL